MGGADRARRLTLAMPPLPGRLALVVLAAVLGSSQESAQSAVARDLSSDAQPRPRNDRIEGRSGHLRAGGGGFEVEIDSAK
jgi:hypothetical protein